MLNVSHCLFFCCFPTLEARVSVLETRLVYYTHPSGKEPTAKMRDLMRLSCVAVKVGKWDFCSSSPGASWLQREAWKASAQQRSNSGLAAASRNNRDPSLPFPVLCPVRMKTTSARNVNNWAAPAQKYIFHTINALDIFQVKNVLFPANNIQPTSIFCDLYQSASLLHGCIINLPHRLD